MQVLRRRRDAGKNRSGAALVETALVLPIFFTVILGIVEFGRAMMVAQLLNNGAREAARLAIMDGSTNAQVDASVRNFVSSAVGVDPAKLAVTITVTPATGNPDPANDVSLARRRDLCQVQVKVSFSEVDYIPSKFLGGAQLTGQAAMRHE